MACRPRVLEALREDDDRRLEAALPGADEETRYCYRWMLLDNLVHEFNALRGALGEPDRVAFAELSRRVVAINMTFAGVECHLSWVDLPGIARYRQEFMFLAPDQRLTLTLPSPYLRNMPSELTIEGGEPQGTHSWSRVEIVSYEEAFKRELVEFHAAIREQRTPRTDGIDGLHDVALCHSIAQVHMTRRGGGRSEPACECGADMTGEDMTVANAPCSYGAFEITVGVDPNVPSALTLLDEVIGGRVQRDRPRSGRLSRECRRVARASARPWTGARGRLLPDRVQ